LVVSHGGPMKHNGNCYIITVLVELAV
jgi:hypothetical protein